MAEQVNSTWLIKRNGSLNANVVRDLKLIAEDSPVAVFCIIGLQSSGKSTLLNHLFGTDFQEMDAENGRPENLLNFEGIKPPKEFGWRRSHYCHNDTEGGDGEEQEDDITFEKQTALFALAVSDTIVVNMWCTEVGRNQGARWPLLMIIFEIDVQAMSHYEHKKDDFKKEVADLKEKIISCSTSVESNRGRIAASGFDVYAKRIWDSILENKDLNLPRERIMVAEVRCNQIAKENYKNFCENESWSQIKKDAYSKTKAKEFGDKVNSLIADCLSREERRKQLTQELLQIVEPIHRSLLVRISHEALKNFKNSIDLKEKYENKGYDLQLIIQDYIPDFRIELEQHFADASIEHANWDHSTKQLDISEDEAKAYLDHEKNRLLNKEKKWVGSQLLHEALSLGFKAAGQALLSYIQSSSRPTTTNIPQGPQPTTSSNIPQPTSSAHQHRHHHHHHQHRHHHQQHQHRHHHHPTSG